MPAYTFNRSHAVATTTATTVLTVPADHKYILTGLRVSNKSASVAVTFRVWVDSGGTVRNLVGYDFPLGTSTAMEVLEGSKIILVTADVLKVISDTSNSADVFVSYLDEDNS